ncbi:MAG: hypothetical protein ACLFUS_10680 [Candidatus Sumerlaeia bacterium]
MNTAKSQIPPSLAIQYCQFCGTRVSEPVCSCGARFHYSHSLGYFLTRFLGLGYQVFQQIKFEQEGYARYATPSIYEYRFGRTWEEWVHHIQSAQVFPGLQSRKAS